jgi:hypothetical protein
VVLAEAIVTACHAPRINYANAVIYNPAQAAANAAPLIVSSNVGGAVIVGTAVQWATPVPPNPLTNPFEGMWDTSATDVSVQNAVVNAWNTLSRCATGT